MSSEIIGEVSEEAKEFKAKETSSEDLKIPNGIMDLLNGKDFDFNDTNPDKKSREQKRWLMIVQKSFGGTVVDYKRAEYHRLKPGKHSEFSTDRAGRFVEMEIGGERILAPAPWLDMRPLVNPFSLAFDFEDEFDRPVNVEDDIEDFKDHYSRDDLKIKTPAILDDEGQVVQRGTMTIYDRSGKLTTLKR